jgi:hypothetical protein
LQQEFITPYPPEQDGMIERMIRTLSIADASKRSSTLVA